ncbi:putative zinc-binding peptidase [Panacibacter sp. DH6]|uniref:Zinc-binding peptidase n=1 Tax=Panacibacter microcysteis TaxID=2793269 RepID=A0A931GYR5_9BACT|nr:putative zinc-binding peptidase [Panacibacter microcysteis]MBG9377382.1 putative zinc-binding peptidase [Panacibacter microcysteis]
MKLFKCTNCNQPVYFENTFCNNCNAPLGFVAEKLQPVALTVENNGLLSFTHKRKKMVFRYCNNHQHNVCNWLVPADSLTGFCTACELNRTIPDITQPQLQERWRTIEVAKHRLVYQLLSMKLPVYNKLVNDATGLVFDFKADESTNDNERVMTGHDNGVITLNIAEADDIEREMARKQMDEIYRTVLGHFRHEIGHYYWDRLIANTSHLQTFRTLFGDDTLDYGEALQQHYNEGAPANWNEHYISAYATMHPWEDWAETWAHYMHIIDTLETAYSFGMSVHPLVAESRKLHTEIKKDPYSIEDFDTIIQTWLPLTFAMNSLNRSMGLKDIYPFVITQSVKEKMRFIHRVVRENAAVQNSVVREA